MEPALAHHDWTATEVTDDIHQRLISVMDMLPDRKVLARVMGLSDSQVFRLLKGENAPKFPAVVRLAQATGVSLDWLASGSGRMFRGRLATALGFKGRLSEAIERVGGADRAAAVMRVTEPLLDDYIHGSRRPDGDGLARLAERAGLSLHWLVTGEPPKDAALGDVGDYEMLLPLDSWANGAFSAASPMVFRMNSDAMEDTIRLGDILLIDTSRREAAEGLFLLSFDDRPLVRRVSPGQAGVSLFCDNPAYPMKHYDAKDLNGHILGRVIWRGRSI